MIMRRTRSSLLTLVLMVLGTSVYSQSAKLVINELKANVAGGCDLVELRVIQGGSMLDIALKERNDVVLTFTEFTVDQDDLIVVHFNGFDATCNPKSSGNETMAVDENPNFTYGVNIDNAFDWYTTDPGLVGTDNVISLLNPDASMMDCKRIYHTCQHLGR